MESEIIEKELRTKAITLLSKEYSLDKAINKRANSIVFFVGAFLSTVVMNAELEPFSELVSLFCFYKCLISYMESMTYTNKISGEILVPLYSLLKLKVKLLKYKEFFENEALFQKYIKSIPDNNLFDFGFSGEIKDVKDISYLKLKRFSKKVKDANL